jgi:hypothetical protein
LCFCNAYPYTIAGKFKEKPISAMVTEPDHAIKHPGPPGVHEALYRGTPGQSYVPGGLIPVQGLPFPGVIRGMHSRILAKIGNTLFF